MNKSTKLYCSIKSLLTDANKILEPINDIQNKDYNEMLRRLSNVMNQNVQLISQMKDVSQMNDDIAANFIFNCNQDNIDFGTRKQLAVALIYTMGKMCDEVKKSIKTQYAPRYHNIALELVIDMTDFFNEYCYTHWDKCDISNYVPFPNMVGRRSSLDLNDQREVIRSMFWMETIPSIDNLSFRDIRPHIQILIRQALEMLFKQIIGYVDIVDLNGNRNKKFTQIGAKFLDNYRDKRISSGCVISGDGWNIKLNMPIKTLERLNTWCNNFTHDPFIVSLPIIYFAYDQYERFVCKCITKPFSEISGVEKMRTEFTVFVIKQDPKVQVKWPDGITIAEQSVKMRKTAIKNNIKNIKRAYWKEKIALLQLSSVFLIRKISNLIYHNCLKF